MSQTRWDNPMGTELDIPAMKGVGNIGLHAVDFVPPAADSGATLAPK